VTYEVSTSVDMESFGRACGVVAEAGDVLVLTGELGAGKTTFTRGLGEALDLETPVSSPTFIVARTHARKSSDKPPLVHVDAYRLTTSSEWEDLDIDVAGSIVVAEWAAPYVSVLTDSWLEIRITRPTGEMALVDELEEPRMVSLAVHGPDAVRYQKYVDVVEAL